MFKGVIKQTMNIVTIAILCLIIALFSGSAHIINNLNHIESDTKTAIETQNREQARKFLVYINNKLNDDIQNKDVNVNSQKSVSEWATDNLKTIKTDSFYSEFSIMLIRYNQVDENFYGSYLWSTTADRLLPEGSEPRSSYDILVDQNRALFYFSKKKEFKSLVSDNHISFKAITSHPNMTAKVLKELQDNKVFRYKNPKEVDESLQNMYAGTISSSVDNYTWESTSNKTLLAEWTTIPPNAIIGINGEPKTINGWINPKYERLVILSTVDSNYVERPFEETFKSLEMIKTAIYILLGFFVVLSLFFLLFSVWLHTRTIETAPKTIIVQDRRMERD